MAYLWHEVAKDQKHKAEFGFSSAERHVWIALLAFLELCHYYLGRCALTNLTRGPGSALKSLDWDAKRSRPISPCTTWIAWVRHVELRALPVLRHPSDPHKASAMSPFVPEWGLTIIVPFRPGMSLHVASRCCNMIFPRGKVIPAYDTVSESCCLLVSN